MAEKREQEPGFQVWTGRGFQITLENGYTLSVMFGPYNHCENGLKVSCQPEVEAFDDEHKKTLTCKDAEVAVIHPNGELIPLKWFWPDHDDVVAGHVPPDEVAQLLAELRLIKIHEATGAPNDN